MRAPISSIRAELEESIKHRVDDVLVSLATGPRELRPR
jgi:hypothetical protein